ncbi:MAG: DUF86 domain-containing protein [Spirochaetia bacterium]|nr:DUF86 domain-containing protein [Spirochaetia bacterium]
MYDEKLVLILLKQIAEAIKKVDKITEGTLFDKYPDIDWKGAKGFRDIIAHQYFDVDHEEVFSIIQNDLQSILDAINKIMNDFD